MQKESDLKVRIAEFLKHLGIGQAKFADNVGVSKGFANNVGTSIRTDILEKIVLAYPELNINWLLFGQGGMVHSKRNVPENTLHQAEIERLVEVLPMEIDHIRPQITEGIGVPYFDVDFVGGFDAVIEAQTVKPLFHINYPPYNDCTCWVNMIGDSMHGKSEKSILPNSVLAMKYEHNWQDFTLLNENYGIVTDEFRTVKMLGKGQDDEHFNMIPHNEYYSPQQIPKRMIRHLFRVKGGMKKFF